MTQAQANPTRDPSRQLNPEEMVAAIADLAADRKALDIVQLDLRGMIGYADYFVICHRPHRPPDAGDPRRHP